MSQQLVETASKKNLFHERCCQFVRGKNDPTRSSVICAPTLHELFGGRVVVTYKQHPGKSHKFIFLRSYVLSTIDLAGGGAIKVLTPV